MEIVSISKHSKYSRFNYPPHFVEGKFQAIGHSCGSFAFNILFEETGKSKVVCSKCNEEIKSISVTINESIEPNDQAA